jgi:hypothetical protein
MRHVGYRLIVPGLIGATLLFMALWQATGQATPTAVQDPRVRISHGPPVSPKEFNGDVSKLPPPGPIEKRVLRRPLEPNVPAKQPLPGSTDAAPAPQPRVLPSIPAPTQSFKGLDFNTWGAGHPPDTVGDVGPNHYIQAVNTAIGIYSKTGTQLAAFTFDTLWTGTGTACDANNQGDPTVIYDPLADRWFVADFAFTGNGTTPPFYECIAVSQTSDPVGGGWYLYAIRTDDTLHPWFADYPKMGIWPDGLYMSANMFDSSDMFK